jgi:cytochrome c2
MLVRSRELLVGFLLLLTISACGQQGTPIDSQDTTAPTPAATAKSTATTPPTEVAATPTVEVTSASESPTATSPMTPTIEVASSISQTIEVTATASATVTVEVPVSETAEVTVSSSSILTSTSEPTSSVEISAATGAIVPSTIEEADPALVAAGLEAYHAYYCGVCHTLDKAETKGTFGPPHNGLAARVANYFVDGTYKGAARNPAEYVHESLVDPQVFIVPGYATTSHRMPNYSYLDDATLNALVAFLLAP